MLKFDKNVDRGYRSFDMVNSNDEKLLKLGLEPLYNIYYPRYINLRGNTFYGGSDHYECDLMRDIVNMLNLMVEPECDRFTRDSIFQNIMALPFKVYKGKLFFNEWHSVEAYERFPHIREELKQKYNLSDDVYIPTLKEIFDDYSFEYFCKVGAKYNEVEHVLYNLTPREHLEMFYIRRLSELKIFNDPNEMTCDDVRMALNYNANIYMEHKVPMHFKGVYNVQTMDVINQIRETKIDIYNALYDFAGKTHDMKKSVDDLFIELKKYRNNPNFDTEEDEVWRRLFPSTWIDLMIQFIGFDKIETQMRKTITTSKNNIYEEFFNYLIMDYNIVQIPRLVFDEDTQSFRWICPNDFITTGINRECENDIKLIKKYVPYDKRDKYLR